MMELEELGSRLRVARQAKGLTQEAVADGIGVSRSTYTHYERGRHAPAPATLVALSELLGIDVDFLLQGGERPVAPIPTQSSAKEVPPSGTQWERMANQLADALSRQLAIMEIDKQNERLRIEKVDAVHADAILRAQDNMQTIIEEMRRPHDPGLSDESEAAETSYGR